jgi:hypothetical protein
MLSRDSLNITGGLVAIILTGTLLFVVWGLLYIEVPDKNQNALLIVLGALSTNITTIIGFFFGSSVQAKKQADTIGTLVETNKAVMPATPGVVELTPGDTVKVEGVNEKH